MNNFISKELTIKHHSKALPLKFFKVNFSFGMLFINQWILLSIAAKIK